MPTVPRPCAPVHPEPIEAGCELCRRARECGQWQRLWGLPVTAPDCVSIEAPPAAAVAGPPATGPGAELVKLLAGLGVSEWAGCQCASRAALMNQWGPTGWAARRDEIAGWLREEWAKLTPRARRRARWRAVASGFWHPLDPFAALVDRAIAAAAAAAGEGGDHVDQGR